MLWLQICSDFDCHSTRMAAAKGTHQSQSELTVASITANATVVATVTSAASCTESSLCRLLSRSSTRCVNCMPSHSQSQLHCLAAHDASCCMIPNRVTLHMGSFLLVTKTCPMTWLGSA